MAKRRQRHVKLFAPNHRDYEWRSSVAGHQGRGDSDHKGRGFVHGSGLSACPASTTRTANVSHDYLRDVPEASSKQRKVPEQRNMTMKAFEKIEKFLLLSSALTSDFSVG